MESLLFAFAAFLRGKNSRKKTNLFGIAVKSSRAVTK